MEEYDWLVSKYIPEDSSRQYSIDELLHDLGMTKGASYGQKFANSPVLYKRRAILL